MNPKENNWKWGNWEGGTKPQTSDYPKQQGGGEISSRAHFALTHYMK